MNSQRILLSIIMPIYNMEEYIDKAVKSVMMQQMPNIEIILVDDGSTDNSGTIIDEYKEQDSRIVVIHQKNSGMPAARYSGVLRASGKYITFVDSDDWIQDNTYENLVEYMLNDVDMISFHLCRYYSDDDIRIPKMLHSPGFYSREDIDNIIMRDLIWNPDENYFGVDPSIWSKIVKRDLMINELEKVQKRNFTIGEDASITWPLFKHIKSLYMSEEILYYHRQRIGNVACYIRSIDYNRKLVDLYEYLISEFDERIEYVKQIDWFFAIYAQNRLKIYNEKLVKKQYLFPFDKVEKDDKIVLYGAGDVGKSYYKQIKETGYCDVIAWLDRKKISYLGIETFSPDRIQECIDYDHVVIGIANSSLAQSIKTQLVEYGVDDSSIVWKIIEL